MIKLVSIKLNNFISHSDTTVEFNDVQKLIITGKSGSGKSSIVEALIWSLYGNGRGLSKYLVKRKSKVATVTLTLFDNKNILYYTITRSINTSNKHTLSVTESKTGKTYKPVKATGLKGLQEYIDKNIINASYLLFINSIIYPQDTSNSFIYQTATKRKDILLEIAYTESYDEYYKKAKELLGESRVEHQTIITKSEEKENQIKEDKIKSAKLEEYKKNEINFKNKTESAEEFYQTLLETKKSIDTKRALLQNKQEQLTETLSIISRNEHKLMELNQKIIDLNKVDRTEIEKGINELNVAKNKLKKLEECQTIYMEWNEKMNKLIQEKPPEKNFDGEIEELNKQIVTELTKDITFCPEIGRECSVLKKNQSERIAYLEGEISTRNSLKIAQDNLLKEYSSKLEELGRVDTVKQGDVIIARQNVDTLLNFEKKMIELNGRDSAIANITKDIETINKNQEELKKKKEELEIVGGEDLESEDAKIKIELNKQLLATEQMENHGCLMVAEEAETNIKKNKVELKKLIADKEILTKNIDELGLVKEAFANNGIRSIIIDILIPKLEDIINETLEKLSDFSIRLDTQKSGAGKDTTLEGLFLSVVNGEGEELAVENLSGGESVKISSAIFEGLASISNCSFRIMDESVVGLDSETIQGFCDITMQLQKKVNQLICISHIQEIQDLFEERIEIIKQNGNSIIK